MVVVGLGMRIENLRMFINLKALICICVYFHIREVKDRDEINEFLRNEIRLADMKAKVRYVYLPSNTVLHNCRLLN